MSGSPDAATGIRSVELLLARISLPVGVLPRCDIPMILSYVPAHGCQRHLTQGVWVMPAVKRSPSWVVGDKKVLPRRPQK